LIDSSRLLDGNRAVCRRCGVEHQLESIEALFTDTERRCSRCGYRFVAHLLREMRKTMEMALTDPVWAQQFYASDREWLTTQMKALVPIEDD